MFQFVRIVMSAIFLVAFAGCGGGGSSSGGGSGPGVDPANPWIGSWSAVSENGAPATGQLTLNSNSFSQTSNFQGGTCTWTGSVSGVTATNLTITTGTASGAPQCSQAIGRSASPTWMVTDGNNTLTLDYRGTIPFGTLQIWSRN
ncbi:MAG: hypothetical protein OEQ39_12305 [Gammaproteobacteria bacterium]|nr:hypothetical protein [Gammaproteobacteria bacterium]MDH3465415.1 hypothetical protein [Gammaproteobacteria bacterium]